MKHHDPVTMSALAAAIAQGIASRLGILADHVSAELEPASVDHLYNVQVLTGPWIGAPACHRYTGKAIIIGDPTLQPDVVAHHITRAVDRFAHLVSDHHRVKRGRLICRQPKEGHHA